MAMVMSGCMKMYFTEAANFLKFAYDISPWLINVMVVEDKILNSRYAGIRNLEYLHVSNVAY